MSYLGGHPSDERQREDKQCQEQVGAQAMSGHKETGTVCEDYGLKFNFFYLV
jgi:hypothetical protein